MALESSVRVDNRLDDTPMMPVVCHDCGARVLARKSTWNQTSVQLERRRDGPVYRTRRGAEDVGLRQPGFVPGVLSAERVDHRCGATR